MIACIWYMSVYSTKGFYLLLSQKDMEDIISNALRLRERERNSIKSRVKFVWKFKDEIEKTIDMVEAALEKDLRKYFEVDSIVYGKNNLKIRMHDDEQGIAKIINCVFRYDKTDMRYGNINIEFVSSEASKRPAFHFVWKFSILDREKIVEKVLKDVVVCMREVD